MEEKSEKCKLKCFGLSEKILQLCKYPLWLKSNSFNCMLNERINKG